MMYHFPILRKLICSAGENEESHITCLLRWSDDCEQVGIHFEWNPILWFLAFFVSVVTEVVEQKNAKDSLLPLNMNFNHNKNDPK